MRVIGCAVNVVVRENSDSTRNRNSMNKTPYSHVTLRPNIRPLAYRAMPSPSENAPMPISNTIPSAIIVSESMDVPSDTGGNASRTIRDVTKPRTLAHMNVVMIKREIGRKYDNSITVSRDTIAFDSRSVTRRIDKAPVRRRGVICCKTLPRSFKLNAPSQVPALDRNR